MPRNDDSDGIPSVAIDRIAKMARDAMAIEIKPADEFDGIEAPAGSYFLIDRAKGTCELKTPRLPREHVAEDLVSFASLIAYINPAIVENDREAGKGGAMIFQTENRLVAVLDTDAREDSISFELPWSAEFQAVLNLHGRKWKHRDLITHLRTKLRQCIADPILTALQNVKISENTESKAAHDTSGLSREAIAKAANADKLPEEIKATLTVYTPAMIPSIPQAEVEMILTFHGDEGLFSFDLINDSVVQAKQAAADFVTISLQSALSDAGTSAPIFHGRP